MDKYHWLDFMVNIEKLKVAVKGKRILLLGPTGSGKGNRSKDLKALGLIHVGLGAIMREKVRDDPNSELSKKITETTQKGTLLSDEIVFPIILDYLNRDECQRNGFVLEGFPRTKAQAEWLLSKINIDIAFLLEVPKSFLIDGIIRFERRSCVKCLATYSDFDSPEMDGICDKCGGELIKRMSDSEDRVRTRLKIYEEEINSFLRLFDSRVILQRLPIIVYNNEIINDRYLKKLKNEVFWVDTDSGEKARMLNYDGMRIRLHNVLSERLRT